jgi:HSP20 family protein
MNQAIRPNLAHNPEAALYQPFRRIPMLQSMMDKEIEDLHYRICKWKEQLSNQRISDCFSGKGHWIPAADVLETEDAYHIFVDLSGVDASTVNLTVEGRILKIKGERHRSRISACTRIHQLEIDYGLFQRSFEFPVGLNTEGAESQYRNGMLEIMVPKAKKTVKVQMQSD